MAYIKNANNALTKGINEIYGLATTALKGGDVVSKAIRDVSGGLSNPGGYLGNLQRTNQIVSSPSKNTSKSVYSVMNNQKAILDEINKKNGGSYNPTGGSLYGGRNVQTSVNNAKNDITNTNNSANKAYEQQRKAEIDAINANFAEEQNRLAGLDTQIRDNYNQSNAQFDQYLPQFQNQVNTEKANQLGSLDNIEIQRKQESEKAMGQVRQALAELQRRQSALLGASGGFNSSAADASGEMFSRQAFQGLGNVQQQRDNAISQINDQRNKVNDFYSNKLLEGEQKIQSYKADLQKQFMSQLNAIADAQGQSAAAKRQATLDAWRNYTDVSTQLNQQLTQQKLSLDQWAQQANSALDSYSQQQVNPFSQGQVVADTSNISMPSAGTTNGVRMDYNDNGRTNGAYDTGGVFAYNDPYSQDYQLSPIDKITYPSIVQKYLYS